MLLFYELILTDFYMCACCFHIIQTWVSKNFGLGCNIVQVQINRNIQYSVQLLVAMIIDVMAKNSMEVKRVIIG